MQILGLRHILTWTTIFQTLLRDFSSSNDVSKTKM